MKSHEVWLPLPPSMNRIYRVRAGGAGVYKTEEAKAWQEEAKYRLHNAKIPLFPQGKVVVEVRVKWPDDRIRDVHNLGKLVLDSIQDAGIVTNDRWILWREMNWEVDRNSIGLWLKIYKFD